MEIRKLYRMRFDPTTLEALKSKAKEQGRTQTSIIEEATRRTLGLPPLPAAEKKNDGRAESAPAPAPAVPTLPPPSPPPETEGERKQRQAREQEAARRAALESEVGSAAGEVRDYSRLVQGDEEAYVKETQEEEKAYLHDQLTKNKAGLAAARKRLTVAKAKLKEARS